jgi:hypothetical protein
VPLEGVEVTVRRRLKDRRPERQVGVIEDGVVVITPRLEAIHQLAESVNTQPERDMIVERCYRMAEERAVVCQAGIRGRKTPAHDVEVEPVACFKRGDESPLRTRRGMALAHVSDLHRSTTTKV